MCRRLTDNKDNAFKGMEVFPSLGNLLLGMFVSMHSFMTLPLALDNGSCLMRLMEQQQ
jgi:hypothetical protein